MMGGKFADGAYTAAFQHLLNQEQAIDAGIEWVRNGGPSTFYIDESNHMGKELLAFEEVQTALKKLRNSDSEAIIKWTRSVGKIPKITHSYNFFKDLGLFNGISEDWNGKRFYILSGNLNCFAH